MMNRSACKELAYRLAAGIIETALSEGRPSLDYPEPNRTEIEYQLHQIVSSLRWQGMKSARE